MTRLESVQMSAGIAPRPDEIKELARIALRWNKNTSMIDVVAAMQDATKILSSGWVQQHPLGTEKQLREYLHNHPILQLHMYQLKFLLQNQDMSWTRVKLMVEDLADLVEDEE